MFHSRQNRAKEIESEWERASKRAEEELKDVQNVPTFFFHASEMIKRRKNEKPLPSDASLWWCAICTYQTIVYNAHNQVKEFYQHHNYNGFGVINNTLAAHSLFINKDSRNGHGDQMNGKCCKKKKLCPFEPLISFLVAIRPLNKLSYPIHSAKPTTTTTQNELFNSGCLKTHSVHVSKLIWICVYICMYIRTR